MKTVLLDIFDEAVKLYSGQAEKLLYLAEHRYDVKMFPTSGQYDWFSGVLLYCLIRYTKPARVIEVSTSSGYSTIFSATALKDNNFGKLYTFELSPIAAKAALNNFKRFGVSKIVDMFVGDALKNIKLLNLIRAKNKGKEIIFLDSEHTEEFVKKIIPLLLKNTNTESLFHIHDILPKNINVMHRPLAGIYEEDFRFKAKIYWILKRIAPILLPRNLRNWVKPVKYDINYTTESWYIHKLAEKIPGYSQLFVHSILDRYPGIDAQKFSGSVVGRCDKAGKPMEWNESWWVKCQALKKALNKK
jgi:predicted O-methyltransferase YrrM